ncbi:hypothetical protein KCP74_23380 [Salmonella enterica subsp. enterica]|nr:hypothetical protein KCP74_23380 [Salmonella enterica subsp. enterica]
MLISSQRHGSENDRAIDAISAKTGNCLLLPASKRIALLLFVQSFQPERYRRRSFLTPASSSFIAFLNPLIAVPVSRPAYVTS